MDTPFQQAIAQLRALIEEARQARQARRAEPSCEGPKDYVDLPDGTRINSSTPRAKP